MKFKFLLGLLGVFLIACAASATTPSLTGFSPNYGWSNSVAVPGNVVTISGNGLYPGIGGTLVVKFNGVTATNYAATDTGGTEIQAQIRIGTPSGTGPVFVSVNGVQATDPGLVFSVIGPNDPYVTDFSPPIGQAGSTPVTLTGVHFANATHITAVKFNGVAATLGAITQDDSYTVTVPATAQTGFITVEKTGARTFTNSTLFYINPVITNIAPTSGRAGTNVVIRGTSFLGSTAVKFGSTSAASFVVDSNSQITAVAPNNVVNGAIKVEAPGGTNTFSSPIFTVAPNVTGFSPTFGSVGNSITVSGTSFTGASSVKFGGISASFSGVTATSLTAVVPSGATNAPISVTTADGTGTSSQTFYVTPTISSFTPTNSSTGTTVKITGSNFTGATAVNFNGVAATSFVVSNNTTIGAVVPSGITTGPISVTTPAGIANSTDLFYAAPVVGNFVPMSGSPGTRITIHGQNLLGTTSVLFNGTNASFNVTNNTVLGATVPNNAVTGPITVIAPAGTNSSSVSFTVLYTNDVSVFITNSPNPVFVTSNLTYTITVANWAGPYQAFNVMFTNTLPASVTLKAASTTQGTLNTNANPITGSLGNIPAGNSAIITLTVVPQAVGTITDNASAGSDNSDSTPANNVASNDTTVWPLPILGIQNVTNQIKVFWPSALSNFTLLYKTNLIPVSGIWLTNTNAHAFSGTNVFVMETNVGAMKFFRLKQ